MATLPSSSCNTKQRVYAVIATALAIGAMTIPSAAAQAPSSMAVCKQMYQCPNAPGYSEMAFDPSLCNRCTCCFPGNGRYCNEHAPILCNRNTAGLQQYLRCVLPNTCSRCADGKFAKNEVCPIPTCILSNCARCVDGTTDTCAICKEGYSFDAVTGACKKSDSGCRVANCAECDPADINGIICQTCKDAYEVVASDGSCKQKSADPASE